MVEGCDVTRHMVDDVVTAVERKVEKWTHIPMENFEFMNVLRYGHGQKYGAHIDTFEEGEPRVATVLMYLSGDVTADVTADVTSPAPWSMSSRYRRRGRDCVS